MTKVVKFMKPGGEMVFFYLDESGKKVYCDESGNPLVGEEPVIPNDENSNKEDMRVTPVQKERKSKSSKRDSVSNKDTMIRLPGDIAYLLKVCMLADGETVLRNYVSRILSEYISTRIPDVKKSINELLKGRL